MTNQKITPATDEEVAVWGKLRGITSMSHSALIARIDADREDLATARARVAELEAKAVEAKEDIQALHLMAQGVKHYSGCDDRTCPRCRAEDLDWKWFLRNDRCPNCQSDLDTGWECNGCFIDWQMVVFGLTEEGRAILKDTKERTDVTSSDAYTRFSSLRALNAEMMAALMEMTDAAVTDSDACSICLHGTPVHLSGCAKKAADAIIEKAKA